MSSDQFGYLHSLIPNQLNHFSIDGELIIQVSNINQALVADISENQYSAAGYIFENNNLNSKNLRLFMGLLEMENFYGQELIYRI